MSDAQSIPMDGISLAAFLMLVARHIDAVDSRGGVDHALSTIAIFVPLSTLYDVIIHSKSLSMSLILGIEKAFIVGAIGRKLRAAPYFGA